MTLFLVFLLCLGPTPASSTTAARDCLRIATPERAGETNADGSGLYFDLLQAIYNPLDIDLCIEIVPHKRVVHMFHNQTIDASIAFYSEEIENQIGIHSYTSSTYAIGKERLVAIFKKSAFPKWSFPQTLKNRRVAWISGYGYDKEMTVPVDYQKITSSTQGWNLLKFGRIEVLLDRYSDALAAYSGLGDIDLDQYTFEIVGQQNLSIPFAKTKRGRSFKKLFDRRMEELWQNGEIAQIYQSWGRELPPRAE
ncbi:MAG: substrate-binding periplasmic protein [Desulfobulbus sp.]